MGKLWSWCRFLWAGAGGALAPPPSSTYQRSSPLQGGSQVSFRARVRPTWLHTWYIKFCQQETTLKVERLTPNFRVVLKIPMPLDLEKEESTITQEVRKTLKRSYNRLNNTPHSSRKVSTSKSLEFVNMFPYVTKGTLHILNEGPWDGEVILDHLGELNVAMRILLRGKQESRDREREREREAHAMLPTLKMERGGPTKEWRWFLETGNGKKMGSLLKSPEEWSPADILILAKWDLCLTPDLQNYKIIKLYCFRPTSLW